MYGYIYIYMYIYIQVCNIYMYLHVHVAVPDHPPPTYPLVFLPRARAGAITPSYKKRLVQAKARQFSCNTQIICSCLSLISLATVFYFICLYVLIVYLSEYFYVTKLVLIVVLCFLFVYLKCIVICMCLYVLLCVSYAMLICTSIVFCLCCVHLCFGVLNVYCFVLSFVYLFLTAQILDEGSLERGAPRSAAECRRDSVCSAVCGFDSK